jgi:thioesterase domain-containing protein
MNTLPTPEEVNRLIAQTVPVVARSGVKVDAIRRGYVKMSAPLEGNENHIGIMYAGTLFTLAEAPGGVLFFSCFDAGRFVPIVREMNIRFLRKVATSAYIELSLSDEEIDRIRQEAEEKGKADFILESEVRDQNDEVVAVCRGIYGVRKLKNQGG